MDLNLAKMEGYTRHSQVNKMTKQVQFQVHFERENYVKLKLSMKEESILCQ